MDKKGDDTVLENVVVTDDGKGTHLSTWKLTINQPTGYDVEYISGPLSGSKFSQVYTAMGDRTKMEISGEFRMQGADEVSTKKEIKALLRETFTEDARKLEQYK